MGAYEDSKMKTERSPRLERKDTANMKTAMELLLTKEYLDIELRMVG